MKKAVVILGVIALVGMAPGLVAAEDEKPGYEIEVTSSGLN